MQITVDEANFPVKLTSGPMSDEEFLEFCADYPDYFVEMTAEGEIIIMPPNNPKAGARNTEIERQLANWAIEHGRGVATNAVTCFVLPDGSRLAPDAAWTSNEQFSSFSERQLSGAWHLCPDFVIEMRSPTDRLRTLRAKMQEWIDNGAQLAWLIDPDREAVEIYRPGQEPEIRTGIASIAGEGPVEGFVLDLRRVWNPFPFRS